MKRLPELQHNLLEQIIADIPVGFIKHADLVNQALVLINQVNKGFFLAAGQSKIIQWISRKLKKIITAQ